jgi:nicotinate-nucleotide pyrophosphorylase (carboxylating)
MRELREVLAAGADAILLDNLAGARLQRLVETARGGAFVEVSGGIRRENLARFARLRPDAVSLGALTHSARWADLSLSLEPVR